MKKYQVIVVDPPWPIKKIQRKVRPNQTVMDYPVMSLDAISTLPLAELAAENSWCFLWTIQKFLPISFSILAGYGFKYQRTLTWDKGNGMCLFGFHHRTEFVVVGYKGKPEMYPRRKAFPTCFGESSWKKAHSAKPDIFYEKAAAFGSPRIDLFARRKREGWDVWGNEVDSDVEIKA